MEYGRKETASTCKVVKIPLKTGVRDLGPNPVLYYLLLPG